MSLLSSVLTSLTQISSALNYLKSVQKIKGRENDHLLQVVRATQRNMLPSSAGRQHILGKRGPAVAPHEQRPAKLAKMAYSRTTRWTCAIAQVTRLTASPSVWRFMRLQPLWTQFEQIRLHIPSFEGLHKLRHQTRPSDVSPPVQGLRPLAHAAIACCRFALLVHKCIEVCEEEIRVPNKFPHPSLPDPSLCRLGRISDVFHSLPTYPAPSLDLQAWPSR
jgi:hypothetical protein